MFWNNYLLCGQYSCFRNVTGVRNSVVHWWTLVWFLQVQQWGIKVNKGAQIGFYSVNIKTNTGSDKHELNKLGKGTNSSACIHMNANDSPNSDASM